ncbi:unnamed protein product, partial [Choristocarpus tenellus]
MTTQDAKIKWVEGTPFMVDGFRYCNPRCTYYLLTHFHSDHTTGLTRSFSAGTIYTSQGTAALITDLLGVNPERVVGLPMEKPTIVAGFEITLIDANHCPAAVMFLIRDPRPGGRTSLHTGDFRAAPVVCHNPLLTAVKGQVDALYLDTTYCGPRHCFSSQEEVLEETAQLVHHELSRDSGTLFLVGTYQIGKEKVLETVAKAAGSRCLVSGRKARVLRLSGAWKNSCYTTHDAGGGGLEEEGHVRVHAVPMSDTSPDALLAALTAARAQGAPFTSVCGVRPTGWTHTNNRPRAGAGAGTGAKVRARFQPRDDEGAETRVKDGGNSGLGGNGNRMLGMGADGQGLTPEADDREWEEEDEEEVIRMPHEEAGEVGKSDAGEAKVGMQLGEGGWSGKKPWVKGVASMYSVPYSEHSSFTELQDFVRALKPRAIIPTVNATSTASVERMLSHFLGFMDLSRDKKRIDSYFSRPACPPPTTMPSDTRILPPISNSGDRPSPTRSGSLGIVPHHASAEVTPQSDAKALSVHPTSRCTTTVATGVTRGSGATPDAPASNMAGISIAVVESDERKRAQVSLLSNSLPPPLQVQLSGTSTTTSPKNSPALKAVEPLPAKVLQPTLQSPSSVLASSGEELVCLNLVDVEVQRAILDDIERKKQSVLSSRGGQGLLSG